MNTFSHLFEANEGKRMRDIMILKAGSILYSFHEEEDSNIYSYHNRVLHCNFHPFESNSIIDCKYVSFIKLERDIYLLVMLDTIIGKTLISNLDIVHMMIYSNYVIKQRHMVGSLLFEVEYVDLYLVKLRCSMIHLYFQFNPLQDINMI